MTNVPLAVTVPPESALNVTTDSFTELLVRVRLAKGGSGVQPRVQAASFSSNVTFVRIWDGLKTRLVRSSSAAGKSQLKSVVLHCSAKEKPVLVRLKSYVQGAGPGPSVVQPGTLPVSDAPGDSAPKFVVLAPKVRLTSALVSTGVAWLHAGMSVANAKTTKRRKSRRGL